MSQRDLRIPRGDLTTAEGALNRINASVACYFGRIQYEHFGVYLAHSDLLNTYFLPLRLRYAPPRSPIADG